MKSARQARVQKSVCLLFVLQALMTVSGAWAKATLLVDSDQGFPPYLEVDYKGRPTGFAVDLLNAVAQEEDLDLHWKVNSWDRSMKSLAKGEIDILPMMARSSDRDSMFDFSNPILTSYDAIFVRRGDARIEALKDLKRSRILVVRDGLSHEYLKQSKHFRGLILATTTAEAMKRLAAGEADCLLMSRLPGLTLIRNLAIDDVEALSIKVDWYTRVFAFAVTEGNSELIQTLNRGLKAVRGSGVYNGLFDHWIASADKLNIKHHKDLNNLYFILLVVFAALIVGGGFVMALRRMVAERTKALSSEIEERKRAESNLLINEKKFRDAFESTMQGMAISTLDSGFVHVNQSLCNILGYTEQELLGMTLRKLLHPEDLGRYDETRDLVFSGKLNHYDGEIRCRHKGGAFVWVRVFASVVRAQDGTPLEVVFQVLDVSQRKEDERKIAQQLYDLNFLRHALNDHAIVTRVDRYGLIDDINAKGCSVSSFKRDELIGGEYKSFLFEKGDEPLFEDMWSTLEEGCVWQGETTRRLRNGEQIWLNTTTVPHIGDRGKPDFYLSVSTDISPQKRVEAEQANLKNRLQQAEKMESIGRLAGGIAHDFNNILASILGFTDLTLSKYEEELNDKVVQYLGEVYSAGERARDLIAQMMDFSRSGSGESKEMNLPAVVSESLKMLKPTLPSSIEINTFLSSENDLAIMMDPIKIHQVVMNLMINARDSMDGKGVITVAVREVSCAELTCATCHESIEGEFIELSIKDSGSGISDCKLGKIFDPFFTTKDVGKGTGMGLSVVHGVVHEHEGHIVVETREGGGSEFKVLFKPVVSSSASSNTSPISLQKETVDRVVDRSNLLVVDDEPFVGEYLKDLFETAGHEVTLCLDSRQAWKIFEGNPEGFDLLVTDQTMPGLLGTELARKVSDVRENFPILLCTGNVEPGVEQDIEALNVTVLRKPVDPRELLESVLVSSAV